MSVNGLVSTDSRTMLERMRRTDLCRVATSHGIEYPKGAPATEMRKILSAYNIDVTKPGPNGDGVEWRQQVVTDEKGNQKIEMYPYHKPHATHGKEINYSELIDKKAHETMKRDYEVEQAKDREEINNLKSKIDELMSLVGALKPQTDVEIDDVEEPVEQINGEEYNDISYYDMKMQDLRKEAKARGLKVMPSVKKNELISLLETTEG